MKLLQDKTNVNAPDATYPFGDLKDNTGSQNGTPVNRALISDQNQFFEKLMNVSGIVANGLDDNEANGFQLYEALRTLFPVRQKIVLIGAWNMDTDGTLAVAHGLTASTIRSVQVMIKNDDVENYFPLDVQVAGTVQGGVVLIDATNINLERLAGGQFDNTFYNSTLVNRGHILINYED